MWHSVTIQPVCVTVCLLIWLSDHRTLTAEDFAFMKNCFVTDAWNAWVQEWNISQPALDSEQKLFIINRTRAQVHIFCWVLCVTGYLKTNKKQTNFPCVLFPLWRMIQVHNPCMDIWIKDIIQKSLKNFFSGLQCCNVWQMAAPHLLLHLLCRWNCPEPMALLHHVRGLLIIILLSLKLWKHYLKWHHCFWEIQGSRNFCIVSDVCTYLTIACATCYIIMFILWSITITCTEDLHFKTSFWLFWHLHLCFVMCVKCNMFIHSGPWALPRNVCLGALPWPSFSEVMLAQALLAQGIEWYKHW